MEKTTKIWIDGQKENSIELNFDCTDLDQAAAALGFTDYAELHKQYADPDDDDSFLNFEYSE